jgi:hypothetical protein
MQLYKQALTSTHLCGYVGRMPRKNDNKVTVLLSDEEFARLDAYCRERAYKKSTLISRLIKQYLDLEGYQLPQQPSFRPGRVGRTSA